MARVAKLVDAPLWGGGARKGVLVRIQSRAQYEERERERERKNTPYLFLFFFLFHFLYPQYAHKVMMIEFSNQQ